MTGESLWTCCEGQGTRPESKSCLVRPGVGLPTQETLRDECGIDLPIRHPSREFVRVRTPTPGSRGLPRTPLQPHPPKMASAIPTRRMDKSDRAESLCFRDAVHCPGRGLQPVDVAVETPVASRARRSLGVPPADDTGVERIRQPETAVSGRCPLCSQWNYPCIPKASAMTEATHPWGTSSASARTTTTSLPLGSPPRAGTARADWWVCWA